MIFKKIKFHFTDKILSKYKKLKICDLIQQNLKLKVKEVASKILNYQSAFTIQIFNAKPIHQTNCFCTEQ